MRAVLVNNDVGVKDFPTTWHHYHDTLRTQNNRPLADYGTQVVPGAECRLWAAFKAAADNYRANTGTSNPAGKVTVLDNAPTSGVPFTPYTDVFWPGNYAPIRNIGTADAPVMRSVAQHEFAHSFRHQLDGDKAHFLYDSARFWYLRSHSGTSCDSTNHGFAFNEGWAEYWADEVPDNPVLQLAGLQHRAQRGVRAQAPAIRLRRCDSRTDGPGPRPEPGPDPLDVRLQQRARVSCRRPKPIKSTGKAKRPATAVSALVALRLRAGKSLLSDISRLITRARSTVSKTSGFAERALLRARLDQARSLRSTLSYLRSRAEQRRIARLSDKKQLDLVAAKQREYLRKVRSISAAALRDIADRLRRDGDREGAKLMKRAGAGAAAGRLDVLQVAGLPLDDGGSGQAGPSVEHAPFRCRARRRPAPSAPKADLVVPLIVSLVLRPGVRLRARCATGAATSGRSPPAHRPRASSWSRRACRP